MVSLNLMSYGYHAYQSELFPTDVRARAIGIVYSFSRLSVMFSGYAIAFIPQMRGVTGVFAFLASSLVLAAMTIGILGPRTNRRALEEIAG
jgi:putative MFS transporter